MGLAYVEQDAERIWHKNPISGHEWVTYKLRKTWFLLGGTANSKLRFKSEKAAQEHADFLNNVEARRLAAGGKPWYEITRSS